MGLDPDEVQTRVQRQAMQTFLTGDGAGAYYEGLRSGGNLSEMRWARWNTMRWKTCSLLPQQDRLVLRIASRPTGAGSGWMWRSR